MQLLRATHPLSKRLLKGILLQGECSYIIFFYKNVQYLFFIIGTSTSLIKLNMCIHTKTINDIFTSICKTNK